jgi:glycosyltransferase involved in cell wall biosynthesis
LQAKVAVSVIVPVYNPGPYIEPCLKSLLGQTLPRESLELIFVNDGSTDDTPERLQALAADNPHVRVITIPNSGWPGKPRNVGTDAAQGEYVMYVDQDDALEPESLERMHTLGSANDADVVLGKVISDFRGVHHNLYRHSIPRCDVFSGNLLYSLTPHKMLRTDFLRRTGIRYPEGPRRLEDQLFMSRAYFAARSASIVADYVCYRYLRRADGRNAGSKRIDPRGYYGNLREVLDVVDAGTSPGTQRNEIYQRFLRTEMLGRLGGPNLAKQPLGYLTSLHSEVRTLMEERFSPDVDRGLGVALRGQAALARMGTLHEISQQAAVVDSITAAARLVGLRNRGGQTVEIDVEAHLLVGGRPLVLEPGPTGWRLPRAVTGPALADEDRVVEAVETMLGDVVVRHRQKLDEWFVPGPLRARIDVRGSRAELIWSGTATVDVSTAAGGAPLRHGLQDLFVRLQGLGVTRSKRLGEDRSSELSPLPLLVDDLGRLHRVYDTDLGNLSLNVDALDHWIVGALANASFVDTADGRVVLDLGVVWSVPPQRVALRLTSANDPVTVEWQLHLQSPGSTLWVASTAQQHLLLREGSYQAEIRLSSAPGRVALAQSFEVDSARRRLWLTSALTSASRGVVRGGRRVLRSVFS